MPAVSEAQRRYLNAKFGHAWVKKHHFDNHGPLPKHKGKRRRTDGALNGAVRDADEKDRRKRGRRR